MAYPTSGSGGVEKKEDTNKLYNTISCPCFTHVALQAQNSDLSAY